MTDTALMRLRILLPPRPLANLANHILRIRELRRLPLIQFLERNLILLLHVPAFTRDFGTAVAVAPHTGEPSSAHTAHAHAAEHLLEEIVDVAFAAAAHAS